MNISIIEMSESEQARVFAALDRAAAPNGRLEVVPASVYQEFSREELMGWCVRRGYYCLPTKELVTCLRSLIGERRAIEIGSGSGVLARALGIVGTDSFLQQRPEMRAYYELIQQVTVPYGQDVEKLDALGAVRKYRPEVVIGAWITHLYEPARRELKGSLYGVAEEQLFELGVERYVHVGHVKTHANKPLKKDVLPTEIVGPWLYGRAADAQHVVWVWDRAMVERVKAEPSKGGSP